MEKLTPQQKLREVEAITKTILKVWSGELSEHPVLKEIIEEILKVMSDPESESSSPIEYGSEGGEAMEKVIRGQGSKVIGKATRGKEEE